MNNDVLWTLVVIATIVYEVIVIYMYLRDFLEPKPYNKIIKASAFIVFFIVGALMNIFVRTPAITLLYDLIGVFSLSFLFGGDIKIKIFATILLIAFLIASEIITLFGIIVLSDVDAHSVLDQASLRLLGVIISKTTLLIITKITCALKKKNHYKIPVFSWIAFLSISTISILAMHDITMNNIKLGNSKLTLTSLIIVIGLFYINILVFYLFESFIEKTEIQTNNKLLEKQIKYPINHYNDLELSQNQDKPIAFDFSSLIYKKTNKLFYFSTGSTTIRLCCNDILYFESNKRKVKIFTKDSQYEFYAKLQDIYNEFKNSDFIYTHKSFLVNMHHIKEFHYLNTVLNNGFIIPISGNKLKDVRIQHLKFLARSYKNE